MTQHATFCHYLHNRKSSDMYRLFCPFSIGSEIMTIQSSGNIVREAFEAGADGYCLMDESRDEIPLAIERIFDKKVQYTDKEHSEYSDPSCHEIKWSALTSNQDPSPPRRIDRLENWEG
jgi:DNA-binding NarL/FixJ family response regulator